MQSQGPVFCLVAADRDRVTGDPVLGQWHQQESWTLPKVSGRKWWVVRGQLAALRAGVLSLAPDQYGGNCGF